MTQSEDQIARLGRAYAAWEGWQKSAERASEEEFLAHHVDLRDLLEPMLRGEDASAIERVVEAEGRARLVAGDRIGAYRIIDRIGEGGMGEVFVAQQESPVRRRVAVKVLKRGMDSDEIIARFEAERQALARMNHPNIAQVFDGGVAPDGRPFFVLEYVPGRPIVRDCDARRLTTRQRLELFAEVLDAVQHAHHKGVIHRDLKPSNILVTEMDGRPVPKIIDFGIAKAADHALTDRSLYTRIGQVIGTPEYMSPEQARGTDQDIDTRTDVYSAGAVLYELLAGTVPIDVPEHGAQFVDGVLRAVCDTEPPRPSTRVTRHDTSGVIAASRGTDPAHLRRQLSGELDWIVLRALEKDRSRRYATAAAFAADIRAFLEHRPVEAGPPTARYRIRKFVQRYRTQVLAAAFVVLALVAGLISSLVLYLDAETAREVSEQARAKEVQRAEEARAVTDFLVDLFRAASPSRSLGEEIPVGIFLDEASRRLDRELAAQPSVRGRLLESIGGAYGALGSFAKAEVHLRAAIDAWNGAREPDPVRRLNAEAGLATVLRSRGDPDESVRQFRAILDSVAAMTDEVPLELVGKVHLGLGLALEARGDHAAAEREVAEGLAVLRGEGEGEREDIAYALHTYGLILHRTARYEEADARFVAAREMLERVHPEGSAGLIMTLIAEARGAISLGDHERADALTARALAMASRIVGDDHPILAHAHAVRAHALNRAQRQAEAEPHLRTALDIRIRTLRAEHPDVAWSHNDLATVLLDLGRPADAVPHLEQAVRIYRANDPDRDSMELATALANHANALHQIGRIDDALPVAEESLEVAERSGDSRSIPIACSALGGVLSRLGRQEEAVALCERAEAVHAEHDPRAHLRPWVLVQLALAHCLEGEGAEGEAAARHALEVLGDEENWYRAAALDLVGWARLLQGDHENARRHVEEAVAEYDRFEGLGGELSAYTFERLGLLVFAEDASRAAGLFARARAVRVNLLGPSDPAWLRGLENEVVALLTCGRADEAQPLIEAALGGRRKVVPAADTALAVTLSLAARVALATSDVERAVACARESRAINAESFGAEDVRTAAAATLLGKVLTADGQHGEAETLLSGALAIQEERLPTGHRDTLETLRGLAELCEARGQHAEAAAWRQRLEDR